MGRIFTLPPSPFEIQHSSAIIAGIRYQAEHDGALPNTPMWKMLERRHELNPARFRIYHPNVSLMLDRLTLHPPAVVHHHGWTGHMRGGTLAPLTTPHAVASVPEPSSAAMWCVGLAVALWIHRRFR